MINKGARDAQFGCLYGAARVPGRIYRIYRIYIDQGEKTSPLQRIRVIHDPTRINNRSRRCLQFYITSYILPSWYQKS
jgi:hypothetical protein